MRAFLLIFFLSFCANVTWAQQRTSYFMWPYGSDDRITFTEPVTIPSSTSDSMYNTAKRFVLGKFHTDRDTINFSDDRKTVTCKCVFPLPIEALGQKGKGFIGFTLKIACNYKTYRYTISDLEHFPEYVDGANGGALENDLAACGGKTLPLRYWNDEKAKAYYYIQGLIESLKESMNKLSLASK